MQFTAKMTSSWDFHQKTSGKNCLKAVLMFNTCFLKELNPAKKFRREKLKYNYYYILGAMSREHNLQDSCCCSAIFLKRPKYLNKYGERHLKQEKRKAYAFFFNAKYTQY